MLQYIMELYVKIQYNKCNNTVEYDVITIPYIQYGYMLQHLAIVLYDAILW